MAWWGGGNKQKQQQQQQKESSSGSGGSSKDLGLGDSLAAPKSVEHTVVSSTLHVVQDAAGTNEAVGAVGAEQREAIRMENRDIWGRVKEGDTLWSLSEKYLGDATKWPHLHAACRKELGPDPLRLLPGTYVTEACLARAREASNRRSRN